MQDANDDTKMERFLNTTLSKLHLERAPYRELAASSTSPRETELSVPQAVARGSLRATSPGAGNAAAAAKAIEAVVAKEAAMEATAVAAAKAKEAAEVATAKVSQARSIAASALVAEREARGKGEHEADVEAAAAVVAVQAQAQAAEAAEAAAVEAAKMKFRQEQEIEEEKAGREAEKMNGGTSRLPISAPEIPCTREHFARFDRGNYYGTVKTFTALEFFLRCTT